MMSVLLASVLSLYVRYDFRFMEIPQDFWYGAVDMFLPNVLILLLFFTIFRLYNSVWRYASDAEMINNGIAVILCTLMQQIIFWIYGMDMPASYSLFLWFFLNDFYMRSQIQLSFLKSYSEYKDWDSFFQKNRELYGGRWWCCR